MQLGINCVSVIKLYYYADSQKLICDIESDEFKENAQKFCSGIDLNREKIELNMAEELENMKGDVSEEISEEEWQELLRSVGDFFSEFYFSLKKPSTQDAEKFFYKHKMLDERYESGVVLYRNAFSISSYEGKKIGLDLENVPGSLQRLLPILQEPGGYGKIKYQGKLLLIK